MNKYYAGEQEKEEEQRDMMNKYYADGKKGETERYNE